MVKSAGNAVKVTVVVEPVWLACLVLAASPMLLRRQQRQHHPRRRGHAG